MRKILLTIVSLLSAVTMLAAGTTNELPQDGYAVNSPDGNLQVRVFLESGKIYYSVTNAKIPVLEKSRLGFTSDVADFSENLSCKDVKTGSKQIAYDMTRIKTSHVDKPATTADFTFEDAKHHSMTINFVVENSDIAFRYSIPTQDKNQTRIIKVLEEKTSFKFPEQTLSYVCPQITPMTGWSRSKPSYEEEYKIDVPVNTKSQFGVGYTFPCLFKAPQNQWTLISETGTTSQYCGCRLSDWSSENGYTVAFPQEGENNGVGSTYPGMSLPAATPWRTITVGNTLKPIVETTVPYDVVEPLYKASQEYKPGRYTWSWIIWQDNSCNYDDQVTFIDLAAREGYEYILVDALWDTQIGREGMEKLANYARSKNVRLLVWYNSNGIQNDAPQGPRDIMCNSIKRKQEMAWMKKLGIAGIKVDFFGGDKQETMKLYEDILSDANDYGIQVIFHGCTLPRGWERMYPNFVASEAALASENVFFSEYHANKESYELCMYPYTRNAVAAFDWGGVLMNKYMSKDNKSRHARKTTDIFEMATAITNQTSVNCVAITPQSMEGMPQFEEDFLKQIPTTWDEVKFIDGYPGKYFVVARRTGDTWYVAAINGSGETQKLTLNLDFLAGKTVKLYANGKMQETKVKKVMKFNLPANDGLIMY